MNNANDLPPFVKTEYIGLSPNGTEMHFDYAFMELVDNRRHFIYNIRESPSIKFRLSEGETIDVGDGKQEVTLTTSLYGADEFADHTKALLLEAMGVFMQSMYEDMIPKNIH